MQEYRFWQNEDDSLTGYMKNQLNSQNSALRGNRTMLHVKIIKEGSHDATGYCNGEATALIRRISILETPSAVSDHDVLHGASSEPLKLPATAVAVHDVSSSSSSSTAVHDVHASPDRSKPLLTLLNLMHVGKSMALHADALRSAAALLSRLDNLSHILVWYVRT